jgi:ankyrin repeat protein
MSAFGFVTQPLVRAVCEDDTARVRELLAAGASLDEPDSMMGPPALAAVQMENRKMLALLLEHGADPNGSSSRRWGSPLSEAALKRDVEAVKLLLEKGADPNQLRQDSTALMSAIAVNDVKIAELLLAAGADVFKTNRHGVSPATVVGDQPPSRPMAKLICSAAETAAPKAGLADAARFGATERVRELSDTAKPTELLNAAGLAVEHDRADALRALLAAGVEPNVVAPQGSTGRQPMPLLHLAVHLGHDDVIAALLAAGADPNLRATVFERAGTTPLMVAAEGQKLARVKTLLEAGADPQARDEQGETALALARKACRKPIIKHLESLAAQQPEPVSASASASVSLHDAVRDGRLDVVRRLLAEGADVNARDRDRRTPLAEAIAHDNPQMLALLLEHGADPCVSWPQAWQSTWNMALRQRSAVEMAKPLLAAVDHPAKLAATGAQQSDPVSDLWAAVFAVEKGAGEIARLLLGHGLDPNQRFADDHTPLMWAATFGHAKTLDAVQALLEAGADAHAVKPPDPASVSRRRKLVEELAKRGLQYTPRPDPDAEPQTVLELARRHNKKVYQTIRDHVGARLDAYDQADAELSGLKSTAREPWFTQLADELAEKLKCKPQQWRRRAGVLHFSAKLSRLPDSAGEGDLEESRGEASALVRLEPLQHWVRQRNASLVYVAMPNDARNITRLLLAPTTNWIVMLRMCGTNGVNHGLSTRDIVQWLLETGKSLPFELQGCGLDFVAFRFLEPIHDYEALHAAMLSFCPDLSDGSPEDPAELAEFYTRDRRCFLWWD